ncbi:MAG: DUF4358 domain-containing protein [Ruminococcaceae bacterium]|nr:DUF4358 domain-containing protein [Oscillospiraceae bacterium]
MKQVFALLLAVTVLLSLTACSGQEEPQPQAPSVTTEAPAAPADMSAIYEEMEKTLPEMIPMDETTMLNFCGISAEDCTQVVAAICADGLITDEVWLIEAKDEASLATLKSLAESRLKAKGEESITYSPEQYAVVQKAQIICDGLYMALIVSPDVDTLAEIFNGAIG